MLRKKGFTPQEKTVNIVFMNGGVGDHIATLVAVNYILAQYPWIRLLIYTPDFLKEFAKHVLPKYAKVFSFSEMKTLYDNQKPTKTTEWDGHTSPMKIHCLDYAFLKLCDENPPLDKKNYLKVDKSRIDTSAYLLPEKYLVITTGFTAAVREFPAQEINKIIKYSKSKGYEIVFLGQTSTKTGASHVIDGVFNEEIAFEAGLNLIDKTTLLQAAKIMGSSAAVLGVDNGLLHVAGCTDVPIVGGFTTVNPELRMPVRHNQLGWNYYPVTPNEDLSCRYCQVTTNFLYGHDYTKCIYGDKLCTTQMTAEKFIAHLEEIL